MATGADPTVQNVPETPLAPESEKRGVKRHKVRQLGSDSSADGDLSYLDLDTGRILAAVKDDDKVSMSTSEFDNIMKKFEKLESRLNVLDKLEKLDTIEKNVLDLNVKMHEIEKRVKQNESATNELQQSVSFVSAKFDEIDKSQNENKSILKKQNESVKEIKNENEELKKSLQELRDMNADIKADLLDSKCREMRDNLVFTNIDEQVRVSEGGRRYEDTESVLNTFLHDKLNLQNIRFERVHRIPTNHSVPREKPRPIVAKFSYFKDRETVRRSGFKLKGSAFGINEQFPEEIENRRRVLYPIARYFRDQNKRTVLVRDRLFVDGNEVRAEDVNLPDRYKWVPRQNPGTGAHGPRVNTSRAQHFGARHDRGRHQNQQNAESSWL